MELREKLKAEINSCDWEMLKVHHRNGAVFMLHDSLALEDVGVALAKDEAKQVKEWMENKWLERPSEKNIKEWEEQSQPELASFLIIQPYVLMKLKDPSL
ncbi:DUF2288 domain-containing protein [Bacteriovoracaceae bacterium]|nr:DUF2288 domain-containing protein [Bacteriovoracaceae bacterium]